jgi:undecaprenyl-diphosphatase
LAVAAAGAVILAASVWEASSPTIPRWEQTVFRSINGWPNWLFVPLWPVMQLGNLAVGGLAGLVVAWLAGRWDVAIGVVLATGLKLVAEKLLRKELHGHVPARVRPGTSEPGAILRGGDVPHDGPSFPSGHALLVAAIACVVTPVMPAGWVVLPAVLAALVPVGRVYVGAHNPLDVACGAGAGMILGGLLVGFGA